VSDARDRPDAFLRDLEAIVDAEQVDVVIPLTDVSAQLAPHLRRSRPNTTIAFPDEAQYCRASDKHGLAVLARSLGVPVPKQVVIESPGRIGEGLDLAHAEGIGVPLVLKPARSVARHASGLSFFGVRVSSTRQVAAETLAAYAPEAYPILVQERIDGPGLGAFVLADRGRLLAAFGHKRLREKPPTGGVSVYRESVHLRDDILGHASLIVDRLNWTGVAMIEFKEDAASGTPYLMEMNARLWGSLQLAIDSGIDFPRMLVDLALGVPIEPASPYRVGVRSRWFWGDVDHLIWMIRNADASARRVHPSLPSRLGALGRFLVPWRPGDRFEVLRLSDPVPFFRESMQWLSGLRH
jgi:predicted ATP-grasp superfamily ATP-dependent carboligase